MQPATLRVLEFEFPPDTLVPESAGRPLGDPSLRAQMRSEAAAAIQYGQTKGVELQFKAVQQ